MNRRERLAIALILLLLGLGVGTAEAWRGGSGHIPYGVVDATIMAKGEAHVDIAKAYRNALGRIVVNSYRETRSHPQERQTVDEYFRIRHPGKTLLKIYWEPRVGDDYIGVIYILYH